MTSLPIGALAGLLSTLAMDSLGSLAVKAGVPKPPHLQYMGRWFLYLTRGQLAHGTIADAPPLPGEALALPLGHYAIGMTLGVAFMLLRAAAPDRTWSLGLLYGALTCALPWFLMFPSMGFGLFGLHGPGGTRLVFMPVVSHLVYGLALAAFVTLLGRGAA